MLQEATLSTINKALKLAAFLSQAAQKISNRWQAGWTCMPQNNKKIEGEGIGMANGCPEYGEFCKQLIDNFKPGDPLSFCYEAANSGKHESCPLYQQLQKYATMVKDKEYDALRRQLNIGQTVD